MSETKKSYTYITLIHVALYVILVPLTFAAAVGSWTKSGNDDSTKFLIFAIIELLGFPLVGFFQYLVFKADEPLKANAYRSASIIELILIFIFFLFILNIGK